MLTALNVRGLNVPGESRRSHEILELRRFRGAEDVSAPFDGNAHDFPDGPGADRGCTEMEGWPDSPLLALEVR